MELTREIFGNIPLSSRIIFYALSAFALGVLGYGIHQRVKLWNYGNRDNRNSFVILFRELHNIPFLKFFHRFGAEILGQRRVLGRGVASAAHLLLFSGFIVLLIGTILLAVDHVASGISPALHFHHGIYYAVYEMILDVFGIFFILGVVLFMQRRMNRPESLGHTGWDWIVLFSFLIASITGFLVEGARIIWHHTPLPGFSPVGLVVARLLEAGGMNETGARTLHISLWWFHAVFALSIVAAFPYTRLFHSLAGTLNILLSDDVQGVLRPVSLEQVETTGQIGAGTLADFPYRQRLQLDACMECGRCQEACPAHASHKPLNPKQLIQDLKHELYTTVESSELKFLHGTTIRADTLWSCTACTACVEVCPVRINPLETIVDLRRYLVGDMQLRGAPALALQRIERSGNPWGLLQSDRLAWAEGCQVPTVSQQPDCEILYWVGCAASYDQRLQRIARAVVSCLNAAGVKFAVLGVEERCTGETARRLGDEFLFQQMAKANIQTLKNYNVTKILTHCPHCFNSFKHDYPQVGGHYEVIHHSQFLAELLAQGRLKIVNAPTDDSVHKTTFHDPCYLARVNRIGDAPRKVLDSALETQSNRIEMERNRERTSCCGGGGGRMWFDEPAAERVGNLRAEEAFATGAKTLAVACPFCHIMLRDGIAEKNVTMEVKDIAEFLAEGIEPK